MAISTNPTSPISRFSKPLMRNSPAFFARTALESVRGTPLADVLRTAFGKLTRGMSGKIQFSWNDLDDSFSRKVVGQSPRDVKRFRIIAKTIPNQLITTFFHAKLGAESAELRKVHPLHLGEVDGAWYLIAHDVAPAAPESKSDLKWADWRRSCAGS